MWERRYGFPMPERDPNGERLYPSDQVQRLRLIKRLMDQGHRPGRLLSATPEELQALSPVRLGASAASPPEASDGLGDLMKLVCQHDSASYVQALQQRLARQGVRAFVQDTVAPLTMKVGLEWQEGRLHIFEEHLFTELTARVLRQAVAAVPGGSEPRVLLTTVPNEPHAMGLLMVEALLSLEGAQCISLGTQMPLLEIAQAAIAHRADVVALSFSIAFPARQISPLLEQLRAALRPATQLWAGGAGARKLTSGNGVEVIGSLDDAIAAVGRWRGATT